MNELNMPSSTLEQRIQEAARMTLNDEAAFVAAETFVDEYPDYEYPNRAQMEDSTFTTVRWTFAVIYSVLFVIGLANVLVLFIVARFSRMRTVTNVFIFNLCLADLVFITFLPFVVCFQLMRSWIFGEFVCKLFFIAESTTKFASVYFVGVLSVDRYLALCHPCWCKRHRSPMLAVVVSAVGWFITASMMTPIYLYSTVIQLSSTTLMCVVKWPVAEQQPFNLSSHVTNGSHRFTSEHYFTIYSFIFCFGAPAIVIICFYFKIVEEMIRASDRAVRLRKRKEQTYKKITRMVLYVVTFYFMCWSPYWIMSFVSTFALSAPPSMVLRILFNILHALPYLNCSVNPILYSLMTETFRKILREIFPWMPYGGQGANGSTGNLSTPVSNFNAQRSFRQSRGAVHNDDETCAIDGRDSSTFLKSSFSHSIRMMSNFSISLLSADAHPTSNKSECELVALSLPESTNECLASLI